MEGVLISSDMLDATATQVLAQKNQMEALFNQISSAIRAMSAFWESPASQAALNQFETLAPIFPKYIQLVDNYCLYLQQTAQAYRENEAALGAI